MVSVEIRRGSFEILVRPPVPRSPHVWLAKERSDDVIWTLKPPDGQAVHPRGGAPAAE